MLISIVVMTGCFGGVATDSADTADTAEALPPWEEGPFATADGRYSLTLLPDPYPVTTGDTTLHLHVDDAATSAPVVGATIEVVPMMSAMGHGISGEPTLTELGEGDYDAAWAYPMDGTWDITVTVEAAPGVDSYVLYVEVG